MKTEPAVNEQLTAWEASILFDIYGGLLTEKKRIVMELYHEENLSLTEIAEVQGVSRAAVFDALKSAENNLREYEKKLGLVDDYKNRQRLVKELRTKLEFLDREENSDIGNSVKHAIAVDIDEIEEILSQLEK